MPNIFMWTSWRASTARCTNETKMATKLICARAKI